MTTPRPGGNYGELARGGVLALRPDMSPVLKHVRDELGRFKNMQSQARAAHHEMAVKAADTIAQVLEERIKANGRTQRPSREDSLPNLLRNPGNIDANANGWVVGKKGFLESSAAAAYFRNLETGTRTFVGREFRGFFISASGKASPPTERRYKRDPRLIQTGPQFGSGKGNKQTTIPVGSSGIRNGRVVNNGKPGTFQKGKAKGKKNPNAGGFRIRITKPIPAYRYFELGEQRYLATSHRKDTYERHLPGVQII